MYFNLLKKTIWLFFLGSNICFAQISDTIVKKFENGLIPLNHLQDNAFTPLNIETQMQAYKIPAVSIAVIKNGRTVLSKAYGEADIRTHRKADTSTLFQVASISKTMNALCIIKQVEAKKLSLDTDFRTYIKDGSFKENRFSIGEKITLANLMSHTAGINKNDDSLTSYMPHKKMPSITQIIRGEKPAIGKGAYCIRKPNEAYQYSNQGINITQKILTDIIEPNYDYLLQKTVFQPLQMNSSSFALRRTKDEQNRLASGYQRDGTVVAPWIFPAQAQGGLVSNASDIVKAVIAIQKAYNGKDSSFIKKTSAESILTPVLSKVSVEGNLGKGYKYGLGVMVWQKGERTYFTHSGTIDGYTALYIGSIDGTDGAVILLNSSNSKIIPEILNSIAIAFEWEGFIKNQH